MLDFLGLFGIDALRTGSPTSTSTRMEGQHMMFSALGPVPPRGNFPSQPKADSTVIASTFECRYYWPRHVLCTSHITRTNSQGLTERPAVTVCSGTPPKKHPSCLHLTPSHPHLVVQLLFSVIALFTPWNLLQRDTDTGRSEARDFLNR